MNNENQIIAREGERMALLDRLKQIWTSQDNQKKLKDILIHNNACGGEITTYGKQLKLTENDRQKKIALLTPREHDLYVLLLEGFTLKESAKQMSIKYSTANTHMTGIYKKLNICSRAELIINYRNTEGKHESAH